MASVEEGLSSTNADVIKATLGMAKGKVSHYVKALDLCLVHDIKTYVMDQIDHNRAEMVYDELNIRIPGAL